MITCGVFYILQLAIPHLTDILGLNPYQFFHQFPNLLYQPISYMFMHDPTGFMHIFFNLFALWMFGTEIERTWGSRSFGRFYLLSGISGALLTLMVHSGQNTTTIGASAGVYGVFMAYWFMFPNRYVWFLVPVKVKWFVPILMILGFLPALMGRGGGIAHMAHLGGVIFAAAYMKLDWRLSIFNRKVKSLRRKRQEAKLSKNRQKADEVMRQVDAILDRINEVGIENLTREERKILEDASNQLSGKNDQKRR
jgi:membrane associated rhomboid family serine protease